MEKKSIWTIAHRGASGHAPENTMAAFRRAVELGARFIETDLQITRDARVIAIHDFTLERTTSGKGQVHLLPLGGNPRIGRGCMVRRTRGRAICRRARAHARGNLWISRKSKTSFFISEQNRGRRGESSTLWLPRCVTANASARVVILSFDPSALDTVHRIDSTMMTGFLCEHPSNDLVERTVRAGARQLVACWRFYHSRCDRESLHRAGLQVVAWTINVKRSKCAI